MASGGSSSPCFMALGVYDQIPSPLHKENGGGREKIVPQVPPRHPVRLPAHRLPEQTGQVQFWWGWVECLHFLRFDFTRLGCPHSGARSHTQACPLNKTRLPLSCSPWDSTHRASTVQPWPCLRAFAFLPGLPSPTLISIDLNSAQAQAKAHLGPQG